MSQMQAIPIGDGFGAEIIQHDFDQPPDGATTHCLRQALLRHGLLLLRGCPAAPARQIAFTRLFGSMLQTCSVRTRFLPAFPEVARVSNRQGQGHLNIGQYWHSDGAYLSDPTAISIHHVIAATEDGDTLYADLARAYERLSAGEAEHLSQFRTRSQTGVMQPLVLPHLVTGRLGLYVNLDPSARIVGPLGQEVPEVREFLRRHLDHPELSYRHKWRSGDMMVVDNFAVAHRATPANPSALRILHRTSIHGPSVWWRSGSSERRAASA